MALSDLTSASADTPGNVVVLVCPECGLENAPSKTVCISCGSTIRIGEAFRWTRQTLEFAGTVGRLRATLVLRFRGWSDVSGTLTMGNAVSTHQCQGTLLGASDPTLRLVVFDEAFPSGMQGRFDTVSFVGAVTTAKGTTEPFHFLAAPATLSAPVAGQGSSSAKWLAAMASLAVALAFANLPYGYYTLLRLFLCGACLYLAYGGDEQPATWQRWSLGAFAVLYNPVLPVRIGDKSLWELANIATVVVLWTVALRKGK